MSRSRRTAGETASPSPRGNPFRTESGAWRGGWLLAASLLCYVAVRLGVRLGLSAGLGALLRAWNVNAETAGRAPGWARALYVWQGSLVTVAVSAATLEVACVLVKRVFAKPARKRDVRAFIPFALAGLAAMLLIAALCLLPDSSRLLWPLGRPRLGWDLAALCGVSLLAALAEEAFSKGVLYDGLKPRWGRAWATAASVACFFLTNGGRPGNVPAAVNALLLGLAGCLIHERRGLWAAAGFRWGWSFACAFLLGFGGGEAAVYRLYGVSETLLTGGDAGPMAGLWAAAVLAAMIAVMEGKRFRLSRGGHKASPSRNGKRPPALN